MHRSALFVIASAGVFGAWALAACGSSREAGFVAGDAGTEGGITIPDGGFGSPDVDAGPPPPGETRDPVDCEEAKSTKSYVGCDYWPTVTPNMVWSIFDFVVVVANTGTKEANVQVTGPNAVDKQVTVPPGELRKIFLPWVPTLKGPDIDECMSKVPTLEGSVVVPNGAYHLVSSSPVIVYQFNALEYESTGGESPDGGPKDWSTCPGLSCSPNPFPCLSFTNDASLLLPSTAMTTNYRVTGYAGFPGGNPNGTSSALSVTATEPNTTVRLALSPTVSVMGAPAPTDAGADDAGDAAVPDGSAPDAGPSGPTVPATSSGLITVVLENAGDVIEFVADKSKDFSGSLVQSDKPVQVISSDPCMSIPFGKSACDHLEETVLPAETLGKHYLVATPTGPKGTSVGHVVRFYGNQNGTKLTYAASKPPACPLSLSAGQVVDCNMVNESFEVTANKEFAVTTFLLGSELYGKEALGDPSQTNVASVEQYRTKYVFLAPTDYPVRWADVTAPKGAEIMLDGKPIDAAVNAIGSGDFQIHRVDLTKSGKDGAHTLTANEPVGVQVIGFGRATSFQYPAGLNLGLIAPPPVPK